VGEEGRRGREERREERAGGLRAGKRARASGVQQQDINVYKD